MNRKKVWWLWGGLDGIYIAWYFLGSFLNGRIPFFSDITSAMDILVDHGLVQVYMFVFHLILQVSIVLSCALFFSQKNQVKWFVYLQTPLRIIFIVPSVSILLMGARLLPDSNVFFIAALVVLSEAAKVWSVRRYGQKV